jgi:hypothetical protein
MPPGASDPQPSHTFVRCDVARHHSIQVNQHGWASPQ